MKCVKSTNEMKKIFKFCRSQCYTRKTRKENVLLPSDFGSNLIFLYLNSSSTIQQTP